MDAPDDDDALLEQFTTIATELTRIRKEVRMICWIVAILLIVAIFKP